MTAEISAQQLQDAVCGPDASVALRNLLSPPGGAGSPDAVLRRARLVTQLATTLPLSTEQRALLRQATRQALDAMQASVAVDQLHADVRAGLDELRQQLDGADGEATAPATPPLGVQSQYPTPTGTTSSNDIRVFSPEELAAINGPVMSTQLGEFREFTPEELALINGPAIAPTLQSAQGAPSAVPTGVGSPDTAPAGTPGGAANRPSGAPADGTLPWYRRAMNGVGEFFSGIPELLRNRNNDPLITALKIGTGVFIVQGIWSLLRSGFNAVRGGAPTATEEPRGFWGGLWSWLKWPLTVTGLVFGGKFIYNNIYDERLGTDGQPRGFWGGISQWWNDLWARPNAPANTNNAANNTNTNNSATNAANAVAENPPGLVRIFVTTGATPYRIEGQAPMNIAQIRQFIAGRTPAVTAIDFYKSGDTNDAALTALTGASPPLRNGVTPRTVDTSDWIADTQGDLLAGVLTAVNTPAQRAAMATRLAAWKRIVDRRIVFLALPGGDSADRARLTRAQTVLQTLGAFMTTPTAAAATAAADAIDVEVAAFVGGRAAPQAAQLTQIVTALRAVR